MEDDQYEGTTPYDSGPRRSSRVRVENVPFALEVCMSCFENAVWVFSSSEPHMGCFKWGFWWKLSWWLEMLVRRRFYYIPFLLESYLNILFIFLNANILFVVFMQLAIRFYFVLLQLFQDCAFFLGIVMKRQNLSCYNNDDLKLIEWFILLNVIQSFEDISLNTLCCWGHIM